ncbi:MAG: hypothetical protein JWP01_1282 [Myxococcales bacterium]|nr:hypothetical protein [Myxococcales bacterium]
MTDDKPERPDPFAPLPMAELPPVRRRSPLETPEEARGRVPAAPVPTSGTTSSGTGTSGAAASDVVTPDTATSWTDVPAPGVPPSGTGTSGTPSTDDATSWTDLPAPPASGTSSEDELRAAVGAPVRPEPKRRRAPTTTDDDDDEDEDEDDRGGPTRRSWKTMLVAALTLVVGGGIAAAVIVGKINSERYLVTCEADRVVVQQGRSFPPWGESPMSGAEWKPLKIPPEAPCQPFETENKAEVAGRYLKILQDQATTLLTAREVTNIDEAEADLKQALLVARSLPSDDDRVNARNEIERLLGDVVYWRASAKLRTASESLDAAAKEFELAAASRPRHVTDASAWALHVRKLVEQLRAGPAGALQSTFPPLPPGEKPTAPPGVALPVEPGAGSGDTGGASEPPPAPPADAGLPTGGVLL